MSGYGTERRFAAVRHDAGNGWRSGLSADAAGTVALDPIRTSDWRATQLYQPTYPYAWQSLQKAQKIAIIRFKFSVHLRSRISSR
jgi:hypothetical protein